MEELLRLHWVAVAALLVGDEPAIMLRGLFDKIAPYLGLDILLNHVVDETGSVLWLASCIGIPEDGAHALARLQLGEALCGKVALHRQSLVVTNIQQSDATDTQMLKAWGARAYICNALTVGDKLIGTLAFASRSRDGFDAQEQELLRTISHYVAVAYERVRFIEQLRQIDRRKDEFLATMAHELRNPLAPLRTAAQILKIKAMHDPDVIRCCHLIERQVGQMARLLEDLVDVSCITRNTLELRKLRVTLASVIDSAVETSRPLIESRDQKLTVILPDDPVYLDADPVRLAQVFVNLLNNAAKFTEAGGHIRLTAEQKGDEVVAAVKDSGIGIAQELLPHLFEMFTRVRPPVDRSPSGLGIGLALSKALIEMHGGSIEARSEGPGRGSEFIVRIPIARPPPLQGLPSPDEESLVAPLRHKLLVADDNRDAAESLALLLGMAGYEVRVAYDGQEAVDLAEAFRPSMVLLDIGMPRLNGYEAARCIRQRPWGKNIPLIAVTGWGKEEDKRRAMEAGFNAHMVKPVAPDALGALVRSLLPPKQD